MNILKKIYQPFLKKYDFYIKKKMDKKICPRKIDSISEEIYKRFVVPFYILILSLVSSSLLIKPKSNKYLRYYKSFIFIIGFVFIIISQIGSRFINQNFINDLIIFTKLIKNKKYAEAQKIISSYNNIDPLYDELIFSLKRWTILKSDIQNKLSHKSNSIQIDLINNLGEDTVRSRYGNLFQMYNKITGEDPYKTPMRIYPAVHYTMGGLWVDYNLMTTVPGLYSIGESNFSDHGANRLGASALMQGLADGYFVLPYTIGEYLSKEIRTDRISTEDEHFVIAEKETRKRNEKLLNIKGKKSVESLHRELGKIMWDNCGMSRNEKDLKNALTQIKDLKKDFWQDIFVPGSDNELNPELEKAGRVADFIELGELMIYDALDREESCGGHFREEHQTPEGEALRDDENYTFVSAWEYKGDDKVPELHKENLNYEEVTPTQRSYK